MLTVLWEDVAENASQTALLKGLFGAACAATETDTSVEVTVLLADDARLQALNRTYRNLDAPTDVLSFPQRDAPPEDAGCKPTLPAKSCEYLGDVAISLDRLQAQAAASGHSVERELAYLFVHGFLHLLGHTHSEDSAYKRMRAQEEAILGAVGLSRKPS